MASLVGYEQEREGEREGRERGGRGEGEGRDREGREREGSERERRIIERKREKEVRNRNTSTILSPQWPHPLYLMLLGLAGGVLQYVR